VLQDGDGRAVLNGLELVVQMAVAKHNKADGTSIKIDDTHTKDALQHLALTYDKTGENHYNLISLRCGLFIKRRICDANCSIC
jgi:ATPase related to the helicase subunit of the Holliday junction resolvase